MAILTQNYLLTRIVSIAFLIYIEEVEKVAEKSNLFITTLHFNYLRIYTGGVATANQIFRGEFFCEYSWQPKAFSFQPNYG